MRLGVQLASMVRIAPENPVSIAAARATRARHVGMACATKMRLGWIAGACIAMPVHLDALTAR